MQPVSLWWPFPSSAISSLPLVPAPAPDKTDTLSLHDALPICDAVAAGRLVELETGAGQRHFRPRRQIVIAAHHVGVRDGQLGRSEEHTSDLQTLRHIVCPLLLEKKITYITVPVLNIAHLMLQL